MRSFTDFVEYKEGNENKNDWKKEFIKLKKGFVPPSNLRPVIQAFLNSNEISIMNDSSKEIKMPKKSLYLVGGSVRDFLKNKTQKNYNLITNATPEQIIIILKNGGFSDQDEENNKYWHKTDEMNEDSTITAVVNGDKFELDTFKKQIDNKYEYTDNIIEDSKRRDLTINSLYIELNKDDGENNKLYDPTKKGWYDVSHGIINFVNSPEKYTENNPLSILRAIRFYSQYGKTKIKENIEKSIIENKHKLSKISYEKIKKEFIKGLTNKDVDVIKFINNYKKYQILQIIFPNLKLFTNFTNKFYKEINRFFVIAWILQNNSSTHLKKNLEGWSFFEKKMIIFLIKIKYFNHENLNKFLNLKKSSGISDSQIKQWAELYKDTNSKIYNNIMNFYDLII